MADRQSYYFHWLLTDGTKAKELRLFGLGELLRGWYRDLRKVLRRERLRHHAKRVARRTWRSGVAAVLAVFGTFAYIAWQTINGAMNLGSDGHVLPGPADGLTSLQSLLLGLGGLYEDNLFLTYFYEFMALEPQLQSPAAPKPVPRPMREGIVFDEVDLPVPRHHAHGAGQGLARDQARRGGGAGGPNGSGKTTLVKLLCRLYDPHEGAITLDGDRPARVRPGRSAREHERDLPGLLAVPALGAAEHLGGQHRPRPGERRRSRRRRATRAPTRSSAGCATATTRMLGKWFEEGEELSIGEWQKVALARAFVRDAEILVFDEPTSALDPDGRVERLRAHPRAGQRTRGGADQPPLLDRAQGRPDPHPGARAHRRERHARGAHGARWRYARMYEVQARAYRMDPELE